MTDDAVPATLIDLAARNVVDIEQRGPGVFYVRLRPTGDDASDGVRAARRRAPRSGRAETASYRPTRSPPARSTSPRAGAAGSSPRSSSDAQSRGLSREAVAGAVFTGLTGAAAIPALLAWAAWEAGAGAAVFVAGVALLGWIRKRHPQRETPAGMDAASRWLGVRAELAENPVFATHSPLQVEIWDRLLAYGAALGVASGASRPLPMGVESDTEAWSAYSGQWRRVRISYPRRWPPGWGADPVVALLVGLAVAVGAGVILYVSGPSFLDAGVFGAVPFAAACVAVVLGAAMVVMAAADWRTAVEVTGQILRLRTFGDDKKLRHYVAVDDGESDTIRAWKVSRARYEGLEQGEVITARLTRNLCCVRWLIRAESDGEGVAVDDSLPEIP